MSDAFWFNGCMVGSYFSQIISIAFRFSVRFADGLQILAFIAIPALYKAFGAPMPDGGVDAFAFWIAYAVVTLVAFRFLFYAPYILWKRQVEQIRQQEIELNKPAFLLKQKMLESVAKDLLELSNSLGKLQYWLQENLAAPHGIVVTGEASPTDNLKNARKQVSMLGDRLAFIPDLRGRCLDAINLSDRIFSAKKEHEDFRTEKSEFLQLISTLQFELRVSPNLIFEPPTPQSPPNTETGTRH